MACVDTTAPWKLEWPGPPHPPPAPHGGRTISPRLESRLLASHLLLAALPTLLLALLGAAAIRFLLDRWQGAGLEESFERSTQLARALEDRIGDDADRLFADLPREAPPPADDGALRELLLARGFAFAAWDTDGEGERFVSAVPGQPDGLPTPNDWARVRDGRMAPIRRGDAFRFFDRAGRAVGVRLDVDVLDAPERAREDYARYRQLSRVERVYANAFAIALSGVVLLTALAAFLVARRTARRISRPVTALAEAADRLAAGDLSHRAPDGGVGEIGELVSAFNRMGRQLEQSRDDLLRMERVAAWRDVARRVAHEIRNPLTPIRLAVHRLGARLPGDDAASRECLASIGEEIENLTRISRTFSEFAKMPDPRFGRIDLARIAGRVVELYRDAMPGVTVELSGPAALPVVGDRDLLRRAISNLVKNAGEALATSGGVVRVAVRRDGNVATIEVADDGPGVPDEIRATLFRPGVSARPGGSGLGLAMVHRIATDHRGTLRYAPRKPGAVFTFEMRADLPEETS